MPTPEILIRLIKNANQTGVVDDWFRVRYIPNEGTYVVWFCDKNSDHTDIQAKAKHVRRADVVRQTYMLFKTLVLDEDPYWSIQIDVTGMPQFLTRVSRLRDLYVRDHVQDLICLGLDIIAEDVEVREQPKVETRSRRRDSQSTLPLEENPRRPSHIFFT